MTREFGDIEIDSEGSGIEQWTDPCEDFISWKKDPPLEDEEGVGSGRAEALRRAIIGVDEDGNQYDTDWDAWNQFCPDWQDIGDPDTDGTFTSKHGTDYYNHLRQHLAKSSVYGETLPIVNQFLKQCMNRQIVSGNPIAFVLEQASPADTDKNYPEITVAQWGDFFASLGDPQLRAMLVTMAKIAIRVGELLNIDLPHLHLDHHIYRDHLNDIGVTLSDVVADYPDSVYIPSEPERGEEFRGEVRTYGNKTSEGKLLPIDRETKRILLDWIAMRPKVGHPHPLFSTRGSSYHHRSRAGTPLKKLKQEMRDYGLKVEYVTNSDDEDSEEEEKNMDNHYFRHFFSTNMQDGKGTYDDAEWSWAKIKIIRGDLMNGEDDNGQGASSDGLQDTYTHDWGNLIREPYLRDIYNFGLYKPERELSG